MLYLCHGMERRPSNGSLQGLLPASHAKKNSKILTKVLTLGHVLK